MAVPGVRSARAVSHQEIRYSEIPADLVPNATKLAAVLVAIILLEWFVWPWLQPPAPESAPPLAAATHRAAATGRNAPSPEQLTADILARPLFMPGRHRPSPVVPSMAAAPHATLQPLPRLGGIVTDGPLRFAVFQPSGADKPILVGEGGIVAGRTVTQIGADSVTLLGPMGAETARPVPDNSLVRQGVDPDASQVQPDGSPVPPGTPVPMMRAIRPFNPPPDEGGGG